MLTIDILKADENLKALTDKQIEVITTLSQNDENSVIAKKTGEIYGSLDNDILNTSGVVKNGSEKTYDYLKRVLNEMKSKDNDISKLKSQIEELTKNNNNTNKSNNTELENALKQSKIDLNNITEKFNKLNEKFQKQDKDYEKKLFDMQVDNEIKNSTFGLQFKKGLPDSVIKIILQQTSEKLHAMNPEYIDNGKGDKIIIFKDKDGAILRNPENQLNPYTVSDIFLKELKSMEILEESKKISGAGTGTQNVQNVNNNLIDISGAKTRVEAYDMIENMLLTRGLKIGTEAYTNEMTKIWKDNNIANLPEK